MARVPGNPKIYHITHLRNLPGITAGGVLWSDTKRIELGLNCEIVGLSAIKRRRLAELEVPCHPGTKVGEYVPFYFCPRSIMLYILHMGNHPELNYQEGQGPILHLQADLMRTTSWAESQQVRWAFSDRNAGGYLARFYKSLEELDKVNWAAVEASDFRDMVIKEGKQAEFLVHDSFPWRLVEKIGVRDAKVAGQATQIVANTAHRPPVCVEPGWYF